MTLLKTILVVDDDWAIRALATHWLEREGYRCITFEGPEELLRYDHALAAAACVDLRLGSESGVEVVRQLRARAPELPAVVMTSHLSPEDAIEIALAGAHDYLLKPLEESRFLAVVARAVEQRRQVRRPGKLRAHRDPVDGASLRTWDRPANPSLRLDVAPALSQASESDVSDPPTKRAALGS